MLTLATGEHVTARQRRRRHRAHVLRADADVRSTRLPAELVCHTALRGDFTGFEGWDVTVVGAGQSALQAGGAAPRARCRASVCSRANVVSGAVAASRDSERSLIDRIKSPMTVLGHGRDNWKLRALPVVAAHAVRPAAPRVSPHAHSAPAAAWWLRDRVEGMFEVETHSTVVDAQPEGDKVRLVFRRDGDVRDVLTEYVVLGTGYDVDVDRIAFIDPSLAAAVARIERAPRLIVTSSHRFAGLYFVGPSTAASFGPLFRFVAGSYYVRTGRIPSSVATRSVAPSNHFEGIES